MVSCDIFNKESHIVDNFYVIENENHQTTIAYKISGGGYIMLVQNINTYYCNDSILVATLVDNKGFHIIQLQDYDAYNIEKAVSARIDIEKLSSYAHQYGLSIKSK
jgi:hypothetical protein